PPSTLLSPLSLHDALPIWMRQERDPVRLLAYLDLSAWSLGLATIGMLVLLLAGIVSGVVGGFFGAGWIWVSLVLFIVIGGVMTPDRKSTRLNSSHVAISYA